MATRGGYRESSGRSKSGYYKGIYCGSTYELAWVIYRLDHALSVTRFDGFILYNGNKKYFPDFVENYHIYEMKGWTCTKDSNILAAKCKAAIDKGYTIDVLFKHDLTVEFEWCKSQYQYRRIEELYDGYVPEYKYECENCGEQFTRYKPIAPSQQKSCSRSCNGKLQVVKLTIAKKEGKCDKIQWPNKDKLQSLVDTMSLRQVGLLLNVSAVAVRNRCDKHNIIRPSRYYWVSK